MKTKIAKTPKMKKDGTPRKVRGPLSAEQKGAMQEARKVASAQVESGLKALAANAQFTNPKFWTRVPTDQQTEIVAAIQKARKAGAKAEIAATEAKLAELRASIEG